MTRVTIDTYQDAWKVTARGHATGSVEVCAAVSTLMTALANWAFRRGGREDQVLEDGYACVVIPKRTPGARAVMDLMISAFEMLAEDEKNYFEWVPNVGQDSETRLLS